MPAPILTVGMSINDWGPRLVDYLAEVEARLTTMENGLGPTAVFACLKVNLPDAVSNIDRVARVTDTNILVASDGVHWIRQDTGAPI